MVNDRAAGRAFDSDAGITAADFDALHQVVASGGVRRSVVAMGGREAVGRPYIHHIGEAPAEFIIGVAVVKSQGLGWNHAADDVPGTDVRPQRRGRRAAGTGAGIGRLDAEIRGVFGILAVSRAWPPAIRGHEAAHGFLDLVQLLGTIKGFLVDVTGFLAGQQRYENERRYRQQDTDEYK